jgi:hypothetical protein
MHAAIPHPLCLQPRRVREVHILDAQLQGFIDAHACAIEQPRQQAELARHAAQHG